LIIFFFLLANCRAKESIPNGHKYKNRITECPQDGTCKTELLKNKSLKYSRGSLGELYIEVVDSNLLVLKFEYKRNQIPSTADSNYVEQVYVQIDNENLETQESDLRKTNIIFARFCYCKGQTGYYKIKNGTLTIKRVKDKTYHLILDFTLEEVPQIISKIEETFTL
jgi:hypothetical protein